MSASPDLRLLAQGIRSLRGPLDLDATARRAVDLVLDLLPVDQAVLTWLGSAAEATPQILATAGTLTTPSDLHEATTTALDHGEVARTRSGDTVVLAFPLALDERSRGALVLSGQHDPDEHVVGAGEILAAAIVVALDAAHTETTLSQALETRGTIGQAQGLLMERYDIDESRAFEVLRRVSQHRNVKLNLIAAETVRTRTTPGLDDTVDEIGRP